MLPQRVCRGTHCAPAALRSDSHGKLDDEACVSFGTHAHPLRCASRHGQKGTWAPNSHTGHRCARPREAQAQALCAAQARPSAALARVDFKPPVAAPAAGRLRGGMRVGARMLRELTRRGCLNGAAQQRSEFHGAPRKRTDAGLSRRGRRLGVAFFCLLFLARQEKKVPRRGHIPAPALNQGTLATIKKIATRASHTTPNPSKHPHPSRQTNRKIHALQQRLKQTP